MKKVMLRALFIATGGFLACPASLAHGIGDRDGRLSRRSRPTSKRSTPWRRNCRRER